MILKKITVFIIIFASISCSKQIKKEPEAAKSAKEIWQTEVEKIIKLFGHRNWIVVADGAYPKQSSPDIKTENIWKEVSFKNKEISDKSNSEFTNKEIWTEDDASVILPAKNYNLRLPKGSINHKSKFPSGTM